MGNLLLLALLVLLAIETRHAWKARSLYCTICGRKMGIWHIETCHKKGHFSPGVAITVIVSLFVAVAVVTYVVMR